MKKESSTNLQKYSGIAEQMIKMSLDCPEITKMILDTIYGDEGKGNGISTINLKMILMAHGQMWCYMREKVTNTCVK